MNNAEGVSRSQRRESVIGVPEANPQRQALSASAAGVSSQDSEATGRVPEYIRNAAISEFGGRGGENVPPPAYNDVEPSPPPPPPLEHGSPQNRRWKSIKEQVDFGYPGSEGGFVDVGFWEVKKCDNNGVWQWEKEGSNGGAS